MKNKIKDNFKLFLLDNLWILSFFIINNILIFIFDIIASSSWLYYAFLLNFIMFCFLIYRFYSMWDFYEILNNKNKSTDDFFIANPKNESERNYQKLFYEFNCKYKGKINHIQDELQTNKIMIYRWVHQIKTPISVIKLIAQKNKTQLEYKKILQAISQIQYDLEQVLNMYKVASIKNDFYIQKISLKEIAKENINKLKDSFIENGVFPKLDISDNLVVYSDYKWISFVIYQLLTNAIKYSNKGGKIYITAYKNQLDKVNLIVKDCGLGIEKEDIEKIFDLFFTGQNVRLRGESTGLGLYMVKKILDYLECSISVKSEIGKGSEFIISFEKGNITKL